MKKYLIDTNHLFIGLRAGDDWNERQKEIGLDDSQNFISVVTVGELWSLSLQNNWGTKRIEGLEKLLLQFTVIDINIKSIIRRYAEIDAYSQGTLTGKPLGISARNMGKNDLWIAATASALDLTLLTTDKDFEHLNGVFLDLVRM
jgi:tRNA(fMet)-specific endonuclease VapC